MSRQLPDGPIPPPPYAFAAAQPDHGAGVALAGFVCGLLSFIAAIFGGLSFILIPDLVSSGVDLLLILAALPLALPGLIFSSLGWRSTSRHRLARTGFILSIIAPLPFLVLLILLIGLSISCSAHSCF